MRLPVEVRLKILRNLSGVEFVIRSQDYYLKERMGIDPDDATSEEREKCSRQYFEQSGQILRICQQLYHEGCQVIYTEHSLGIDIENDGLTYLRILDKSFRSPGNFIEAKAEHTISKNTNFDLLSHLQHEGDFLFTELALRKELLLIYPGLCRFPSCHISMMVYSDENIFVACRFLRQLLRHKKIVVNMHEVPKDHDDEEKDAYNFEQMATLIHRTLQCNGITIRRPFCSGCVANIRPNGNICKHEIQYGNMVESHGTAPQDCFLLYLNFFRHIILSLPKIEIELIPREFDSVHPDEIRKLQQHAMSGDLDAFHISRKSIMKLVKKWQTRWAEKEMKNLVDRMEAVGEYLKDVKENFDLALCDNDCATEIAHASHPSAHCQNFWRNED